MNFISHTQKISRTPGLGGASPRDFTHPSHASYWQGYIKSLESLASRPGARVCARTRRFFHRGGQKPAGPRVFIESEILK